MNLEINIKILGSGRLPLVLFHGWGFDYKIWLSLVSDLEKKYTLYLVDLPGFGKTNMLSWDVFKRMLIEFLPNIFSIVGWSLGGLYATRLAIEEPNRIDKLLVVASSPCFIKQINWPGIERGVFENFFIDLKTNQQQTLLRFITMQLSSTNINDLRYLQLNSLSSDGLYHGLQVFLEWDLRQLLHGYHKPACFVFGLLDVIVPRKTLTVMQLHYPQFCYKLFKKAAHAPFLSHLDEFINTLDNFI